MKISDKFSKEQLELLEKNNIDVKDDFNEETLEELEDKVYDKMMGSLDKNQDFTPQALKWERILDIVVDIENNL